MHSRGFYYHQLRVDDTIIPLGIRSIVGIIPLVAIEVLEQADIYPDSTNAYCECSHDGESRHINGYVDWISTTGDPVSRTGGTGILPCCDEDGLYVDFHSNRHAFILNLSRAGVSPK